MDGSTDIWERCGEACTEYLVHASIGEKQRWVIQWDGG